MAALPSATHDQLWSPAQRARLVRRCAAVVGSAAAEDVAQETLLQAWRLRDRVTDPSGADAWLDAIARNICRRWLRARGKTAVPTSDPEALVTSLMGGPGEARDLDSVLEREELVELLERALGLLPEATRDALVGHYVEELSHAQIAERIGTTTEAVSMRVSRGRTRLRYLLETQFAEETLAEGWSRRADAGWRSTRMFCPECGGSTVQLRHDASEVSFRCRSCDPHDLSVRLTFDAPVFAALVDGLRRPSTIRARICDWAGSYWPLRDPARSTPIRCVRCDHPVTALPYTRESVSSWINRRGWYAACGACGHQVSSSVAGLVLALPEVLAARHQDPRLRFLPVRDVVRDNRPAKVVTVGRPDGTPLVNAVFLRDSLRLVHVDGSVPAR